MTDGLAGPIVPDDGVAASERGIGAESRVNKAKTIIAITKPITVAMHNPRLAGLRVLSIELRLFIVALPVSFFVRYRIGRVLE